MMIPFTSRLISSFALLLMGFAVTAHAQTAETLFHTAANQYIGGDDAAALASVEAGLRLAPTDARLLRLKEEIQRKREQQQNRNQNQQQQQGDDPQQQGQNQPQQDQDGAEGQPPEQQDPGEQGEGDPQQQQGQPDAQPEPGESPTGEQPARPQPDPNRLSQAEAERILQALGNEEETLLRRVARPQTRTRRVEKDW